MHFILSDLRPGFHGSFKPWAARTLRTHQCSASRTRGRLKKAPTAWRSAWSGHTCSSGGGS